MARPKKITQNINKDAGLMDLPKVRVPRSKWENTWSNYISSNIGEIIPVYVDEVLPSEKRKVTAGMISHLETPITAFFNAGYTEFRSFFIPYRLCADLLNGYKTRKSPWVKVFGEDNANTSASIIVPLANQKLPSISTNLNSNFTSNFKAFGGLADALDAQDNSGEIDISDLNLLDFAAYELIYQFKYRNENRESATESNLYKWLYNIYARTSVGGINYDDSFHIANREKDYFTGAQPFTLKASAPITAGLFGEADVKLEVQNLQDVPEQENLIYQLDASSFNSSGVANLSNGFSSSRGLNNSADFSSNEEPAASARIFADLSSASGISIEQLRLMIKTQELLEKDAMYGSRYIESLNSHFGTAPMSLVLEEPLELKKVTITSQMQPIFQTSSTASESTILGTIGANSTTQSGEFEIVPETEFKEHGLLMICAVHKAQNAYDALHYKPKRIFKKERFDFYTPELNDLGFQPVQRKEFNPGSVDDSIDEAVAYNEYGAEYRFKFNKVHAMFEPSRSGALSYWTLAMSNYSDVQSIYKQGKTELDRAISVKSNVAPQFFDAYGFIETVDKPMSLHSIPGMDGVI